MLGRLVRVQTGQKKARKLMLVKMKLLPLSIVKLLTSFSCTQKIEDKRINSRMRLYITSQQIN